MNDKGSCELLVLIVKIETRLEVDTKVNGACLQCQSNYYDLFVNKANVSKIHILVYVI